MSWIVKEVMKRFESEILRGLEDDEDIWDRVDIFIRKILDLPFLPLIAPIISELKKEGYSIKIYGQDTIPTVHIIPKEGKPIIASIIGLYFPIDYAFHPEYSKIIDKITKEVYGLSPPKNYEK